MKKLAGLALSIVMSFSALCNGSLAQDAFAEKAAEQIIADLAAGRYRAVWEQQVSGVFKDHVTEDAFLSGMAMQRPAFGKLRNTKMISVQRFDRDPVSGFVGEMYNVTFQNSYDLGDFYEAVIVVKEEDGAYRLTGFNGAPVPSQ